MAMSRTSTGASRAIVQRQAEIRPSSRIVRLFVEHHLHQLARMKVRPAEPGRLQIRLDLGVHAREAKRTVGCGSEA